MNGEARPGRTGDRQPPVVSLDDLVHQRRQAYADHFIRVHLDEETGDKTYSELSTAAQANPTTPRRQPLSNSPSRVRRCAGSF